MIIVTVIAVMQLAQHVFLGQVRDQAERATMGRSAQMLALSSLQEAGRILGERMNEHGSDLFRQVRHDLPEGRGPIELSIDPGELMLTATLDRDVYGGRYRLGPVRVALHHYVPHTFLDPAEYEGYIFLGTRVEQEGGDRIGRGVEISRGLRVTRPGVGPPLDGATVLFRRPVHLTWDVNTTVRRSLEEYLPQLRKDLVDLLAELRTNLAEVQACAAPPKLDPQCVAGVALLQQVIPLVEELVERPGSGFIEDRRLAYRDRFRDYPPFPEGVDYLLVRRAPDPLDLKDLDLQKSLATERLELDRRAAEMDAAGTRASGSGAGPDDFRAYQDATKRVVTQVGTLLETVVRFRDLFEVLRKGDPGFPEHDRAFRVIDPAQLRSTTSPLYSRNLVHLEEDPPGPGHRPIDRKFADLLAGLDRSGRGFHGVILVKNPTEPMTLAGQFRGRWTLAAQGGLRIQGVQPDGDDSAQTLVAPGDYAQGVTLEGAIRATLVLTGHALRIDPGTRVLGQLLLVDLGRDSSGRFEGSIEADARTRGVEPDRQLHAVLSPWTRRIQLDRP